MTKKGRLAKATQFLDAAEVIAAMAEAERDVLDACVTLLVHAGIAASDAICCEYLGQHPKGQGHRDAIEVLASIDRSLAGDLRALLTMKTQAGYSATTVSGTKHTRAVRAATHLVESATRRVTA
jgi:hypothetical protein